MKIDSSRLPALGTDPKNVSAPATAPGTPAPVPLPQPGAGDAFERVAASRLGSLLGGPALQPASARAEPPEVQKQLAADAGARFAQGDVAGGAAAWTNAVGHDPGVTIAELLPYAGESLAADLRPDAERLAAKLGGASGGAAAEALAKMATILDGSALTAEREAGAGAARGGGPEVLAHTTLEEISRRNGDDLRTHTESLEAVNEAKGAVRDAIAALRGNEAGAEKGTPAADDKQPPAGKEAPVTEGELMQLLEKLNRLQSALGKLLREGHDQADDIRRNLPR